MKSRDELMMERTIALAGKGACRVSPNPMVGCIILKAGRVIGSGYHEYFGGPHAEISAIRQAGRGSAGSCMYVNLEPCSHFGKTPPCTDKIIGSGIKKVVIAMKDPNPVVNGRGIRALEKRGIKVIVGVQGGKARLLNEAYIKYMKCGMPFVTMKASMSLDGKIATRTYDSRWISSPETRRFCRLRRSCYDAILAGTRTVMKDNPRLTSSGPRNPLRVVLDRRFRIPLSYNVFDGSARTLLVGSSRFRNVKKLRSLEKKGVSVLLYKGQGMIKLRWLLRELGRLSVSSLLIEGGGDLNASALMENIVDKVFFVISPMLIGGRDARTPVEGDGISSLDAASRIRSMTVASLGRDMIVEGYL